MSSPKSIHAKSVQIIEHAGTVNILNAASAPALPWNIPTGPDKLIGRDDAVLEVAALIENHRVIVMTGSGGLGKTALAAAAIAQVAGKSDAPQHFTGGIVSHDFYRAPSHAAAVQSILIQTQQDTDERGAETRARAQLAVPHRLIYLEGCEKADDLSALLAIAGPTTVVLTTRNDFHRQHGHEYIVPALSDEHAAQLIHHHWRRGTADACRPLAQMIGGHALACERAGIQLRLDAMQPAALLDKLQKRGLPAIHPHKDGAAARDHEHSAVGHLLHMDAEAVRAKNEHALRLWSLLAFHALSPLPIDPLPDRDTRADVPDDELEFTPAIVPFCLQISDDEAESALDALRTRSLIAISALPVHPDGRTERHVCLAHSLLSEHARPYDTVLPYNFPLTPEDAVAIAKRAVTWWSRTLNRWNHRRAIPGGIARMKLLAPHLETLPRRAQAAVAYPNKLALLSDRNVITLIAKIGFSEVQAGRYANAQSLYEHVLEANERTIGEDHPDTLTDVNNLAYLLQRRGDFQNALPLFLRALEMREKMLGSEHEDTLTSVNNLGNYYEHVGEHAKAKPYFLRAVSACRKTLGDKHLLTLTALNGLACVYQELGEIGEALSIHQRVLELREMLFGREHPVTLTSVNNLGYLYYNSGETAKARALHERALEASERTFGPDHPTTLMSMNNLAALLDTTGDHAKASTLYARAMDAYEKTLGREHPTTLSSMKNLANLRYHQGHLREAVDLMRRVLAGFEKAFGAAHPSAVDSRKCLDFLLSELPADEK